MKKEMVVDFTLHGHVEGMHFDEFDLQFLGPKRVARASEIFFNEDTGLWDVVLPGDESAAPCATGFSGYDTARRFEVIWLQECRKQGLKPDSLEGALCGVECRIAFDGAEALVPLVYNETR